MKNELGLIDWLEMFSSKNVGEVWLVFEDKFKEVVLKNTPIRRRRNNKPLW